MNSPTKTAVLTGSVAGMAMLAVLLFGSSKADLGWDSPLRWMFSLLSNEPALILAGTASGTVSVTTLIVLALSIHFVTSIALARLFLIPIERLKKAYLPVAGAVYGCAIWAIMTFGLLLVVDEVMYVRVRLMPLTFLAAHLVYGMTLAAACFILDAPVNQR